MKRRCTAALARSRVASVRRQRPGLVLSADLMVGFPTESEAEFADTLDLIRETEVAFAHVFAFSPRSGTPAARIPAARRAPAPEIRDRARRARETAAATLAAILDRRVGTRARVLVEKDPPTPEGMNRARAPDFVTVWVPSSESERGRFAEVRYEGVRNLALIGRVVG
jgi:threonylcarbamoyladenosine tRNA methylthiotransferase MtaB